MPLTLMGFSLQGVPLHCDSTKLVTWRYPLGVSLPTALQKGVTPSLRRIRQLRPQGFLSQQNPYRTLEYCILGPADTLLGLRSTFAAQRPDLYDNPQSREHPKALSYLQFDIPRP